eukprot:1379986-Amorphochlora_amoeboformis.AAC.1
MFHDIFHSLKSTSNMGTTIPLKCQPHGNITFIKEPKDFEILSPDGGRFIASLVAELHDVNMSILSREMNRSPDVKSYARHGWGADMHAHDIVTLMTPITAIQYVS